MPQAGTLNYTASRQEIGSTNDYIIGDQPGLLNRVGLVIVVLPLRVRYAPYFAPAAVTVKMQNFSI